MRKRPTRRKKKHGLHRRNVHQMGQKAAGDGSEERDDPDLWCRAAQPMDGELWVHIRLLSYGWADVRVADGCWGSCSAAAPGPWKWSPVAFALRGPTMIQRPVPVEETVLLRMARPLLSHHRITIRKTLSVALCRTSDKDRLLSTLKAGSIIQP
jgi:hypothetical protein